MKKGDKQWELHLKNADGEYNEVARLSRLLDNGKRIWDLRGYGYLVPHPQNEELYGVYREIPREFSGIFQVNLLAWFGP